jgi:hypothetical protein
LKAGSISAKIPPEGQRKRDQKEKESEEIKKIPTPPTLKSRFLRGYKIASKTKQTG